MNALEAEGIPIYNPRSRDYLEQPEVAHCLGAFIRIIDSDLSEISALYPSNINEMVQSWVAEYDMIASQYPEISGYVSKSAAVIADMEADKIVTPGLSAILYRILSNQPFKGYQTDLEKDMRLSTLTRLFEAFCAQYGRELRMDSVIKGKLPKWWYGNFYYGLCGYLIREGVNDDEDDDAICPPGRLSIMTIHQAKGLEFDFVFVGNLGRNVRDDSIHYLEQDLRGFRIDSPSVVHTMADLQWHDAIRLNYVVYSRVKHALILVAADNQLKNNQSASFEGYGGGLGRSKNLIDFRIIICGSIFAHYNFHTAPSTPSRPRYSVTSDILAYQQCFIQYGAFAVRNYEPALAVQLFYGATVHQVLDRAHLHFRGELDASSKETFPTDDDIKRYFLAG